MNKLMLMLPLVALTVAAAATADGLSASEKDKLYVLTGLRDDTGGERRKGSVIAPITDEVRRKYAIREVVLLFDAEYDFNWVADEDRLCEFFSARGVSVLSVCSATKWLDAKIAGVADGTALVMGNGVVPDTWLSKPWGDSRIVRYLRGGGRIVWAGDVLFAKGQGETGGMFGIGGTFGKDAFRLGGFLGMRIDRATMYGEYEKPIEQTDKSRAWGLEKRYGLVRPVLNDGILDPFVLAKDGSFADSGQICLKRENPLSGIVYLSAAVSGSDTAMLRDMWRCAWWSGEMVKIPEPTAAGLAAASPVELSFGDPVKRDVWLRGECPTVRVALNGAKPGQATLTLKDEKGTVLRMWTGAVKGDGRFASLDLGGLKRGIYPVTLEIGGLRAVRNLRVAPPVDKRGFAVALWAEFSKSEKRCCDMIEREYLPLGLELLPTDNGRLARDVALWYGRSFMSRRMESAPEAWAPEGYDNWKRLQDGEIAPVLAAGKRRIAKGYANPQRRADAAEGFRKMCEYDSAFPAFRGVACSADDYSQWFGPDWNRFNVEGFRNRYGIDLPVSSGSVPEGSVLKGMPRGIVPDDHPFILASKWFAGIFADAGGRLSVALNAAYGRGGGVFPIPGGMQLPMNMWSAMNPYYAFARGGWSYGGFYYYNAYWQHLAANTFWTAAARMGDRKRRVWVMPDCYISRNKSYYEQNLWHLLAGGAKGLAYFYYDGMKDESKDALREAGDIAARAGLFVDSLEPMRAKALVLTPFENMISVPENWHMTVPKWVDLVHGGVDADPAAVEEEWEDAAAVCLFNVTTLTESSKRKMEAFERRGGKVYADEVTQKAVDVARGKAPSLRSLEEQRVYVPSEPGVIARRFADTLGNRCCWFVDSMKDDLYKKFRAMTRTGTAKALRELEEEGGMGTSFTTTVDVREKTGPVAWDVLGRRRLAYADGKLTLPLQRWKGALVAFLPESPAPFEVGLPSRATAGVPFDLEVKTSGKCAVQFTVSALDPEGKASEEYRARLLSDATGCAKATFDFAVNDLRGRWTFRVANEFTGETRSAVVEL